MIKINLLETTLDKPQKHETDFLLKWMPRFSVLLVVSAFMFFGFIFYSILTVDSDNNSSKIAETGNNNQAPSESYSNAILVKKDTVYDRNGNAVFHMYFDNPPLHFRSSNFSNIDYSVFGSLTEGSEYRIEITEEGSYTNYTFTGR